MYNRVYEVFAILFITCFPSCLWHGMHHALDVGSLFVYFLTLLLILIPPTPEKQL